MPVDLRKPYDMKLVYDVRKETRRLIENEYYYIEIDRIAIILDRPIVFIETIDELQARLIYK